MIKKYPFLFRYVFIVLAIILTVYAIIQARDFLYPVTFGILLSYLFLPVANYLEKQGFPRILAILICIILSLVILLFIGKFLYQRMLLFVDNFPVFREKAVNNIESILDYFEQFGVSNDKAENVLKGIVFNIFNVSSDAFKAIFNATTGTIFRIAILPVYIFLFLYYRTKFAYFILKIVPSRGRFEAVKVLKEISTVATRYMGGVFIVVSILCVLNSLGLIIVGIEYPIFLGIISAVFNFIPYFGTWMGGAVPLFFALLISDSPVIAIRVIILFAIIQFIENNILTPNIVGNNVNINPLFIIISLIVGATLWGIPGMLVVVPFLAMLRIAFQNIESLRPYAYLLGNTGTRKHAITRENINKFMTKVKGKFKKNKHEHPIDC